MGYRIYDTKKKKWLDKNVYMTPDGELFESYKTILGQKKMSPLSRDRYIFHESIDLYDKNSTLIHVGDYLKAKVSEDREVTGLVTYASELSAYIILCFDTDEFFTLGSEICEFIEIVGNVFDDFKEDKKDGQQAL